ncbi:hypothetical protein [Caenimonas koreensis]|uniref:Uncharacterized protein n=1 Tax=Caenimonas koreensis DSM 17982 TaxID=1121255 RepID=A0A844BF74_9BURK|nr:hypothetical protein [Caenimonas koreensis]MRD49101.1 hypothetical protein [Caenimonas koreensis DSM 17982]
MNNYNAITIGKFLITPLTRVLDDGHIACSVSVRSGSGSATTDRVLRLTRLFKCKAAAAQYALAEGMRWLDSRQQHTAAA